MKKSMKWENDSLPPLYDEEALLPHYLAPSRFSEERLEPLEDVKVGDIDSLFDELSPKTKQVVKKNDMLDAWVSFFEKNGFAKKRMYQHLACPSTKQMEVSYYPGRESRMHSYAAVPALRGLNTLVIVKIAVKTKGENLLERAAVAFLKDPAFPVDAVVIESILDDRWLHRLIAGKNGKNQWLHEEYQNNVYLTREHAKSFKGVGGKRKASGKTKRGRRTAF